VTTVVQIAPEIGPGFGVAAVANHLEAQLVARGVATRRFTLAEARGGWLPPPGPGVGGKAALAARVVWFSTVGTVLARRMLRESPELVSICHNDVVAGDVYVNHGIVLAAMQARGRPLRRMLRNPLHVFTWARDSVRFTSRAHRAVVNLTQDEDLLLRRTYRRLRPPTVVIGNGVDTRRLRPPTVTEREAARRAYGFGPEDLVVLFVGHEFDRKGLPLLIDALSGAPKWFRLLVVGGTTDLVNGARRHAETAGVTDRVHLIGTLVDPAPAFRAADLFGLPSAYESFGLVVLEAMAYGLPVMATAVGVVPDVVRDGDNGYILTDATDIRAALTRFTTAERTAMAESARATAQEHDWQEVAQRYVELLEELGAEFGPRTAPVDVDARAT
jgi:UDP-glucose:(heptosyl)LPS alpha-1,3-glucosyltransferase